MRHFIAAEGLAFLPGMREGFIDRSVYSAKEVSEFYGFVRGGLAYGTNVVFR